jgi:16S rRNA (guanine966-N2)-methyltransferase
MRVITGTKKGKKLAMLDGNNVRPTSDRVKEAIFSIIQFDIQDAVVVDLFAGSGQLGIEALSRGASQAVFIDSSKAAIDIIKQNLQLCELLQKSRVALMQAKDFLQNTKDVFDIALLDPPYNKGIIANVLPLLVKKMSNNGIIVCEHQVGELLPEAVDNFKLKRQYKYGRINISIYKLKEE